MQMWWPFLGKASQPSRGKGSSLPDISLCHVSGRQLQPPNPAFGQQWLIVSPRKGRPGVSPVLLLTAGRKRGSTSEMGPAMEPLLDALSTHGSIAFSLFYF